MLVLASHLAGLAHAHADALPVNGVIAIGGDAEDRDRAAVTAGVTAATHGSGWQLPPKPLSKKEVAGLLRCLDPGEPWECIPKTIDSQGIHRALVVAAEKQQGDDGSPVVVLTAKLIVTRPHAMVVRRRFCEHCTDDKLTKASSELTQQLVDELAVRVGRTLLEVKSTPAGGRITLDGEPVGATDQTFNTYPGTHVVIIEKPGYLTQTVKLQAEEGKTATVSVTLNESGSKPGLPGVQESRPERTQITLPLTLLGVGGVGVVTAGILIYLGQRDGPEHKMVYHRATALGVVSGVVGVTALGAGAYLWWRGTKATTRATTPSIVGISGGVAIGLARSF